MEAQMQEHIDVKSKGEEVTQVADREEINTEAQVSKSPPSLVTQT